MITSSTQDLEMAQDGPLGVRFTLKEAAQRLAVPEAVVYRLSQRLKIPRPVYAALPEGLQPFRDELVFEAQDLVWLMNAQARLSQGETLQQILPNLFEMPMGTLAPQGLAQKSPVSDPWAHVAQTALSAYKEKNPAAPVFKSLTQSLQRAQSLPEKPSASEPLLKAALHNITPESAPLNLLNAKAAPASIVMSKTLQARAKTLQWMLLQTNRGPE